MKRLFAELTLTAKVLAASFLALAGVIVVTSALVIADYQQEAKARLLTDATARVELTAFNAAPALARGDKQAAEQVLASLQLMPSVLSARLFDLEGRPFADHSRSRSRGVFLSAELPLGGGQRLKAEYLETYRPVFAGGKIIGLFAIATDLTSFRVRAISRPWPTKSCPS